MAGVKRCSSLLVIISIMAFIPAVVGQATCAGTTRLSATTISQYLSSPNYPSNYSVNMNCQWTISSTGLSNVVSLYVMDLDLEGSGSSCPYDSVTIYNGYGTTSPILRTLCGSVTSTQIYSTGSYMTVVFRSDSSNNYKGFRFEYTSLYTPAACSSSSVTAESYAQYITSPNYPKNYLNNMDCTWVITATYSFQVVVLKLLDFNLEGTSSYCSTAYDYVAIYNGSRASTTYLQKWCGTMTTTAEFISTGSSMTVVFHSDGTNTYRGFKLQYTSRDRSTGCSSSPVIATSYAQYITSPNYPSNYSINTDCTWVITATYSSQVVVLKLLDFNLEGTSTACSAAYDYVSIYDGSSTSYINLQKWCGTMTTTAEFISTGSSMTVVFHSDGSNNYRGFKLQYTSRDMSTACSSSPVTATSSAQYITSPNYPSNYLNNMDCTWVITATYSSQVVVVKLLDFYLEGTATSCYSAYDYVSIYDGSSTSSTYLQKWCGVQTTTAEFFSTGSSMTVVFHSDGSNTYRGFKLQYTSRDKSNVCSTQSITASSSSSYLTSPNYPGLYPSGMNCQWQITADISSYVVVLDLVSFRLEGSSPLCSYDYVKIYDGPSIYSSQIAVLCGSKYSGSYSSSGSQMTVVFRSDSSNNYSGFIFSYYSQEASESSSSLSAGGIVGIVICCIAVPCLVVAAIIIYRNHNRRQQIRNNPNRAPIQNGGTTAAPPGVSYVANNPPAVPAPYMTQNPPYMMGPTNYLPPPYSYAMQHGAVPQGQPPFAAPGPSHVGAAPIQGDGGHINKGFSGY